MYRRIGFGEGRRVGFTVGFFCDGFMLGEVVTELYNKARALT